MPVFSHFTKSAEHYSFFDPEQYKGEQGEGDYENLSITIDFIEFVSSTTLPSLHMWRSVWNRCQVSEDAQQDYSEKQYVVVDDPVSGIKAI